MASKPDYSELTDYYTIVYWKNLAFSGVYYVIFQSYLFFSYPIFLWGVASSLGFFFLMHVFYSSLAKPLQWVFAVIFGLFLFWLVIVNYFIFHEFGQFLNTSMIHFILNDTQYILDYFMTFFSYKLFFPFSVLLTYFIWLWFPKSNQHKQTWKTYQQRLYAILKSIIEEGINKKEFLDVNPQILMKAIGGLFHGLLIENKDDLDNKEFEIMLKNFLKPKND